MTRRTILAGTVLSFALSACGSVDLPRERFYRLDLPPAAHADPQRAGVLRVLDLQLGTALDSDCLLVADGVQLEARPLDRWVAPLDRLVTDALVLGLSRSGVVELVKGSADPGGETWSLHGRIVDFAEAPPAPPPGPGRARAVARAARPGAVPRRVRGGGAGRRRRHVRSRDRLLQGRADDRRPAGDAHGPRRRARRRPAPGLEPLTAARASSR